MANLIRIDRNGTKYYEGEVTCTRCYGKGVYIIGVCNGQPVLSPVDNGICFKCGGTGKEHSTWKEYTPEHEAKLAARRLARQEKKLAEEKAEQEAREREAEAERLEEERKRAEAIKAQNEKLLAEKSLSHYVGTVGERVDIWARYIKSAWFEIPSFSGYGTTTMYVHTFKIGNDTIIWKTGSSLGKWNDKDEWECPEEGSQVHLRGTIKEHKEYEGEKQTVLSRCKLM